MMQTNRQQSLFLKERGRELVETNNAEFVATMRSYAVAFAVTYGKVTSDDCREEAALRGIAPEHPNAWGAVFNTPLLKTVGFTTSRTPSCHARTIRVWAPA